jgi:hypothetical protein
MKSRQTLLLLLLVVAGTASAQVASTATNPAVATNAATMVLVDGKPVGPSEPWGAQSVGNYDLTIVTPGEMLIGHLTLTDSAGKLASSVAVDGEGTMGFEPTIAGNELTLRMKRERAPITMHLFHRGNRISGTWSVGEQTGTLEGAAVAASAPKTQAATASGVADVWDAKPIGKYQITLTMPDHDMTADVTIREEGGKLIANIWPVGDNDGRDFGAAVMGNQLVISGPTERGAVTLTLEHRGPKISGTWQLGDQKGALAGQFAK